MKKLVLAGMILLTVSCGPLPQTHYYALALPPPEQPAERGSAVLAVDELSVASAYEDQRIVYRPAPYRFEYYEYHQWSAPPSLVISDYVRDALARSGRFRSVTSERSPATTLVLGGRVSSFEEVDVTPKHWIGRIELELFLEDPRTGERVWTRLFREERRLPKQHPTGLAQALSSALSDIVAKATPAISYHAERARTAGAAPQTPVTRRRPGQASAASQNSPSREP
jgi:ABC-type uncharacterized transport system auxiliary subunit